MLYLFLSNKHNLRAIFSNSDRLIVEAPAGSGKTRILISKIAYNIITNRVPRNKKILALTFSVNDFRLGYALNSWSKYIKYALKVILFFGKKYSSMYFRQL